MIRRALTFLGVLLITGTSTATWAASRIEILEYFDPYEYEFREATAAVSPEVEEVVIAAPTSLQSLLESRSIYYNSEALTAIRILNPEPWREAFVPGDVVRVPIVDAPDGFQAKLIVDRARKRNLTAQIESLVTATSGTDLSEVAGHLNTFSQVIDAQTRVLDDQQLRYLESYTRKLATMAGANTPDTETRQAFLASAGRDLELRVQSVSETLGASQLPEFPSYPVTVLTQGPNGAAVDNLYVRSVPIGLIGDDSVTVTFSVPTSPAAHRLSEGYYRIWAEQPGLATRVTNTFDLLVRRDSPRKATLFVQAP